MFADRIKVPAPFFVKLVACDENQPSGEPSIIRAEIVKVPFETLIVLAVVFPAPKDIYPAPEIVEVPVEVIAPEIAQA